MNSLYAGLLSGLMQSQDGAPETGGPDRDAPGRDKGAGRIFHVSRSGLGTRAALALDLMAKGRSVAIVLRDGAELMEMRGLISLMDPESTAADPSRPLWQGRMAALAPLALKHKGKSPVPARLASLYTLAAQPVSCTLLTADSLLLPAPSPKVLERHSLDLKKGEEILPELIVEQLTAWGYRRVPMVGEHGEFAMRGDIMDIYCSGYQQPVRLEFFGDTLEDLRLFNPQSQRSSASLEELTIIPAQPNILADEYKQAALAWWDELAEQGRLDENSHYSLRKSLDNGAADIPPGLYYPQKNWLEDWLRKDTVFILPGQVDMTDLADTARAALEEWQAGLCGDGLDISSSLVMRSAAEALESVERRARVYFEDLKVGVESRGVDLPERELHVFQDLFPMPEDLERPWHRLVKAMHEWNAGGSRVLLSFANARSRAKFLALAAQEGITPLERYNPDQPGLYALVSPLRSGASLAWADTLILSESMLQPRTERARRSSGEAFRGLDRYDELKPGDFLVHRDYGIAAFGGLTRLELSGVSNDYLLLHYAGDDKLYLPVDRLGLIQLFKAPDGVQPARDKLGGSMWVASKEKARKAIEKIAEDLVEMYAYRKVAKGFTYGPVNEMYREFEASFGFEETPDQARAIDEVLGDMEKPEPMDRLVCGDVGFGKTEVAMRAAFRAALEGRQVVLLCPTTVLAEQHYQTFRARLDGFPVNVGLLSRFVTKTRQKEVLESLRKGQIDILIGTHRILSKDVEVPKLGLIVLDEEQRFGVRHKEILKQMRKNVDVLTLSATPIPRTLQLSLSGIRELSVIETPPPERKPVTTALINREEAALKSVLQQELARQGQVFWVYNRVQGLDRAAEYVKKLAPDARVGMAHGQMSEKALEEAMRKFWHGELDVLVCTAIIESGLDFPKANTLIVDQAQMFGLGQLYQLRGRVGRSDRQAYAVFVVNDVDRMPDLTRKRLRIILEMDYLGAGFQVAMEDLRLRGAGNILGESQSGHMQRVGLDLFLEMLEEAVAKMRGQPLQETLETELNIGVAAHIPETYIDDARERLRYYKALSSAQNAEAQRETEFEIRDRFGPVPAELESFFSVLAFKRHLSAWGVTRADILPDRIRMVFSEKHANIDPAAVLAWVGESRGKARLVPPAGLELAIEGGDFSGKLASAYAKLLPLLGEPSGI